MKESLVKLIVVVIALSSLLVGGAFLIIPAWMTSYLGIRAADPGWLRSIGAATVGLQGFGLLVASFRRRDTNPLVGMVSLVTTLEMGVLWYSLFAGEFGDMSRIAVIAIAILATVAAVLLWIVWTSRRKSLSGAGAAGSRKQVASDAAGTIGDEPQADLVEEIDSQSPRYKK